MKLDKFIYCYGMFLILSATIGGLGVIACFVQHWAPLLVAGLILLVGGLILPLLVAQLYSEYKS